MTRRGIRAGITMVVTGLVALVIGVLSAHYTGSRGPHGAEYTVRWNDEIRVAMGPLAALLGGSRLPLRLGVGVQGRALPIRPRARRASPAAGRSAARP